jgi:16S rRNA (cytosine1402-N4)-methyltransferase
MKKKHLPVLTKEWLSFLAGYEVKIYVDGTLGAGGHAEAVLKKHPEIQQLIGIDQDPSALKIATERLKEWSSKIITIRGNFSEIDLHLNLQGILSADAILLDLGVSSMQLDEPERGFSFMQDGPLDMRMDPENPVTAEEVVNTYTETELGDIFRVYGEERRWRLAAKAIVHARKQKPIQTTQQLVEVLQAVFPRPSPRRIHPMTLVFQGLRIYVNQELEVLRQTLPKALQLLAPGGVLGVISFHSLEDRIVKNVFRTAAKENPDLELLTKKPLQATREEMHENPRSRSAKLRVIEKVIEIE